VNKYNKEVCYSTVVRGKGHFLRREENWRRSGKKAAQRAIFFLHRCPLAIVSCRTKYGQYFLFFIWFSVS